MTTTQNNGLPATQSDMESLEREVVPLEYSELSDNPELVAMLQRCEQRILSFSADVLDGWLGMAGEFRSAKLRLSATSVQGGSAWYRWVARFHGAISRDTANRLVKIGELGREDIEALRSTLFAKSGGIAGIAAYLAAGDEVKEQVRSGKVKAQLHAIQGAERALKEAEEAQKRAEERERTARLAEATVEEKIAEIRREAQLQGQLAVQEATARLQREVDEARHQAELRRRDMEEAQAQIQRAQAEWNERLAYAKKEERERLEADFKKEAQAQQERFKEMEKAARAAQQQAKDLNDRLTHARDSDAVRARWDALAETILNQCDGWLQNLPSVIDAQYFEHHERILVDSVRKRAEALAKRMEELSQASVSVVDAD